MIAAVAGFGSFGVTSQYMSGVLSAILLVIGVVR
jgi:hypothetical protein